MSSDNSQWFRRRLHTMFGRALASIAFFGTGRKEEPSAQIDGLVIEQEGSTEVRQADLARRKTITGALEALKREVSGNVALKDSLWAASNSPSIGVLELSNFVDLCKVLYDPVSSCVIALKYPRYWRVQHLGKVSICRLCSKHACCRLCICSYSLGTNAFLQIEPYSNKICQRPHFNPSKTQERRTGNAAARP